MSSMVGRDSHVFSCFGVMRGEAVPLKVRDRVIARDGDRWGGGVVVGCE